MAPRLIDYNDSLDVIWAEAVYTEARLRADPDAADLTPRMTGFFSQIDAVRTGQYGVWREEIIAQAHVDASDKVLDRAVLATCKELDRVVGDKPDDPRRRRYVRNGTTPKKIAAMRLEAELKVVRDWPGSLATEPEDGLKAHSETLGGAIKRGQAAIDERSTIEGRRRDFTARERAGLVDAFNSLRFELHSDLTRRVIPRKLDRLWPDEFFRKGTNRKDSADQGTVEEDDSKPEGEPT